jgi:hypothetical protein
MTTVREIVAGETSARDVKDPVITASREIVATTATAPADPVPTTTATAAIVVAVT